MVIEFGKGRWDGRKQSTHQGASGKVMPIRGRMRIPGEGERDSGVKPNMVPG
jgi:hypothetical protein